MDAVERHQAGVVLGQVVPERQPCRVLAPAGQRPRRQQPQAVLPEMDPQGRGVVVQGLQRRHEDEKHRRPQRADRGRGHRQAESLRHGECHQCEAAGYRAQRAAARRRDDQPGPHHHHRRGPGPDEQAAAPGPIDGEGDPHRDQRRQEVRVAKVAVRPKGHVRDCLLQGFQGGHRRPEHERGPDRVPLHSPPQEPDGRRHEPEIRESHGQRLVSGVGPGQAQRP